MYSSSGCLCSLKKLDNFISLKSHLPWKTVNLSGNKINFFSWGLYSHQAFILHCTSWAVLFSSSEPSWALDGEQKGKFMQINEKKEGEISGGKKDDHGGFIVFWITIWKFQLVTYLSISQQQLKKSSQSQRNLPVIFMAAPTFAAQKNKGPVTSPLFWLFPDSLDERCPLIGWFLTRCSGKILVYMFAWNKMAVTQSCLFDDAVRESSLFIPKCSRNKVTTKETVKERGLLPTGLGKNWFFNFLKFITVWLL